jgi:hypothetical protein
LQLIFRKAQFTPPLGHLDPFSEDSAQTLDQASRGAFLYLSVSEARSMLGRISGKTPCTSIHNEPPEEEKESSPKQEEVLIAKSQPL